MLKIITSLHTFGNILETNDTAMMLIIILLFLLQLHLQSSPIVLLD